MAREIKGREIARQIIDTIKDEVQQLCSSVGQPPKLVSLSVGHSEDAEIYANMQKKAAERAGIEFRGIMLAADISQEELIREIKKLNADKTVTAVIVQKPLPEGMDHDRIVTELAPEKDVEGIHPCNLGRLFKGDADIVPCTATAVMEILRAEGIDVYGKEVVIIGRSAIVGKPLCLMMLNERATTTVCHTGTAKMGDLPGHARSAEILVVAAGKAEMVGGDWVGEGAVVIDVGINMVGEKLLGDVKFSEAAEKASVITPVPGGVGPVTVAVLMRNVLRTYRNQNVKIQRSA
jgi:methylenetetrahydrofolate dehydrogenase (NADP+)/methenyltetrahydrofolate cyclohydrolase